MQSELIKECRFAHYATDNEGNDFVLIKEQVHMPDKTIVPNIVTQINPTRDFYITKKGKRNHKDKKEREPLDNLDRFECTQAQLVSRMARALGTPWFRGSLRDLHESPYTYGTDISITALIKQKYIDECAKKGVDVTPYSVAAFDTETDTIHGTEEVIMASFSFKNYALISIKESCLIGYSNAYERIMACANKEIGYILKERNITLEVKIVKTEIEVIKTCIDKAHELKPDFLAVWNLAFDMDKILQACEKAQVDPADILNDPCVPKQFRGVRFKKGPAKKVTASGKVMVFKPAQRWHTVYSPASFYWIDAMCAYRHVRQGSAEEPSYALDAILTKHFDGKLNKLKFAEADHLKGLQWHQFMQAYHIIKYTSYSILDTISMTILDEKILDLQLSLPMFAGSSDFENFNSQPKRTADKLHHFLMNDGYVIGTTSGEMATDFDDETQGLEGWITMLPAQNVYDNGLCIIKENPLLPTNIRVHVGDLDVAASYPNGEVVFNISKETTVCELISIDGTEEFERRMATINLSGGQSNALELGNSLFGLPSLDQWAQAFSQHIQ